MAPFRGNQRGLGVMEILVALGVFSIMLAATASYMAQTHLENQSSSEKLARNDLERQLTGALSDPAVCSEFLSSLVLPSTVKKATMGKPVIVDKIKRVPSSVGGRGPNVVDVGSSASPIVQNLMAKDIQLQITGPSTANLKIFFDQAKLTRGMQDLSFPITFQTDVSGTKITGCSSLSAQALCVQLGGTFNPAGTPPCAMKSVTCTSTQVLTTDSSGNQVCKSLSQLVASLCPAGQMLISGGSAISCAPPPSPAPAPTPIPNPIPTPVPTPTPASYPKTWPNPNLVCSGSDPVSSAIVGYYKTYLLRCADQTGLYFWSVTTYSSYISQGMTQAQALAKIQSDFLSTSEYTSGPTQAKLSTMLCADANTMYPGHIYTYQLGTNYCTTP